jgi:hypothetical protein
MALFDPANPARAKMRKPVILPHGTAHKTPAAQTLVRLATGLVRATTRRKKKVSSGVSRSRKAAGSRSRVSSKRARSRKRSGGSSRSAHLVKGSAAAKRRMSALRKMRKHVG